MTAHEVRVAREPEDPRHPTAPIAFRAHCSCGWYSQRGGLPYAEMQRDAHVRSEAA